MARLHEPFRQRKTYVTSAVFVSTWEDGLFVFSAGAPERELAGSSVQAIAPDGHGRILAIVGGNSLHRRAPSGEWTEIITGEIDLACCVAAGDAIYIGTNEPSVLRVNAAGEIEKSCGFDNIAGRDAWYAGSAIINGKRVGPPLGVRSIAATSDGAVILANVHVGGIPRSMDAGATWQPTIDVGADVHEVRFHPSRRHIAAAASALGLCTSFDGGITWEIDNRGLYASHCSAVGFAGDDILVSASLNPFIPEGALYRRGVEDRGPLVRLTAGLPEWLGGKIDTRCISVNGPDVAFVDISGVLYVSADAGHTWSRRTDGIPMPSSVLLV
jgi:hypothetical protein